ncbi:hypothetical protein EMIHUDRAFT_251719 [Emiliania huxleyi CCMP1516]|uniref:RNase III domain-containing protein n=2 Tax=Emiliania huxleyi TaxID=2903 RepID=A0A0D3KSE8_EMIH1|nr:hypothetical protein EMIHUDRAFT_63546 [Emiliania huxleyi CCMP1516]XP_005791112.1 hypothetical protein EMIHUDRAFT_251719 [Emiliania huxleyi CCMP1516]EOD32218.1 hypothetical protein EMIHUDRAFT_63546 [Emiliania huxleyi CCMP1516]EOD38683.1 hypothetical protein EMIHUDRAFT_251719 [Emiliania huxleyi CCMP1516]|eukprot:XP_005784647.1 hypothetical protein EMIHUDRAFT_63546 [Emiliania huxleyi CCMP1516]
MSLAPEQREWTPPDAGDRPEAAEMLSRLTPGTLAYLGDAVYEQSVRERLLWPPSRIDSLTSRVQRLVRAEGQEALLRATVAGFGLSEEEQEWVRRGRNSAGRGPRRLHPSVYRAATGFECLVGYLHITDRDRCAALLEFCHGLGEPPEEETLDEEGGP